MKTDQTTYKTLAALILIGGLATAFVAAGIVNTHPQVATKVTCAQKTQEYQTVADVANATGKLPGVVKPLEPGSKVTVNPDLCAGK